MNKKIFLFLLVFAQVFFAAAEDYQVRLTKDDGDTKKISKRINSDINAALQDLFGKKYTIGFLPPGSLAFYVQINISEEDTICRLNFTLSRNNRDDLARDSFEFDYSQVDSLLSHLKTNVISRDLADLLDNYGTPGFEELLNNYKTRMQADSLERNNEVETIITIEPKWDNLLPDDNIFHIEQVELPNRFTDFSIQSRSKEYDMMISEYDLIISQEEDIRKEEVIQFRDRHPEFPKEFEDYIDLIYISHTLDNGSELADSVLKAGGEFDTRYRVVSSAQAGYEPIDGDVFELKADPVTKNYSIRKLPEYNFSFNNFIKTGDGATCTFDDTTIILQDLKDLGIPNPQRGSSLYSYINKEVADYINANNGNLMVVHPSGINIRTSIVKHELNDPNSGLDAAMKEESDRKRNFLLILNAVMKDGREMAAAEQAQDNQYILPKLPEKIDTLKSDWYVVTDFRGLPQDPMVSVKNLFTKTDLSGVVSPESRSRLDEYITNELRNRDPAILLDVARLYIIINNSIGFLNYINMYEKSPGVNRKYIAELYRNFFDYYHGAAANLYTPQAPIDNPNDYDVKRFQRILDPIEDSQDPGEHVPNMLFRIQKKASGVRPQDSLNDMLKADNASFCRSIINRSRIGKEDQDRILSMLGIVN